MNFRKAAYALIAATMLATPATIVTPGAIETAIAQVQLSEQDQAALQQLNTYLNDISSMSGDFVQTSPRGQVANGVFYISKPGKMRFEYAPPSPLLVVSDGSWVTVMNTERKRDDQYPLSTTPLKMVLADQVDLFRDAIILSVEHRDDLSAITMQEKGQLVAGQLTMVLDRANNQLVQWIVVDGKGQRTSVELANINNEAQPDPKLFVVTRSKDRKSAADK